MVQRGSRFEATILLRQRKRHDLGLFDTAVQAAVAYAKKTDDEDPAAQQCTWAQCDRCQRWRRLQVREEDLPEQWWCELNEDVRGGARTAW